MADSLPLELRARGGGDLHSAQGQRDTSLCRFEAGRNTPRWKPFERCAEDPFSYHLAPDVLFLLTRCSVLPDRDFHTQLPGQATRYAAVHGVHVPDGG
ncbi:hypothetical protein D3C81_1858060 [compost metagenome]